MNLAILDIGPKRLNNSKIICKDQWKVGQCLSSQLPQQLVNQHISRIINLVFTRLPSYMGFQGRGLKHIGIVWSQKDVFKSYTWDIPGMRTNAPFVGNKNMS